MIQAHFLNPMISAGSESHSNFAVIYVYIRGPGAQRETVYARGIGESNTVLDERNDKRHTNISIHIGIGLSTRAEGINTVTRGSLVNGGMNCNSRSIKRRQERRLSEAQRYTHAEIQRKTELIPKVEGTRKVVRREPVGGPEIRP